MDEEHRPDRQHLTQNCSQPSIEWCNEYLARMKNNLDQQSTMISQQSFMINKLLRIYDVKNPETLSTIGTDRRSNIVEIEDNDPVHYFKSNKS